MDNAKRYSYVVAIGSILIFLVLIIIVISTGINQTSYVVIALGAFFGSLGINCFVQPNFFGPVFKQLFKNIAHNAESKGENTTIYTQQQTNPGDSPQDMVIGDQPTLLFGEYKADKLTAVLGPPGLSSEDRGKLLSKAYEISAGDVSYPISFHELQKQLGWKNIRYVVNVADSLKDKNFVRIQGQSIFLTPNGIDYVESRKTD